MAVKYCPVCGKELEEDAVKCKLCGTELTAAAQNGEQAGGNAYETVPPVSPVPPVGPAVNGYQPPYVQYGAAPTYAPPAAAGQVPVYGVYQPMPVYMPGKVQKPGRGAGIASLVLGILAVLFAFSLLLYGISFFETYNNTTVSDDAGYSLFDEIDEYETDELSYRSNKTDAISRTAIVVIFSVLAFSLGLVGRKNGTGVAGTVLGGLSLALGVFSIVLVLATSVVII